MVNQQLSKIQVWTLAARPKTLPAAIGPVIVGTALAISYNQFSFFPAFAALFGALLLQIAANLANDYFDYMKGTDTIDRIGPVRVAASGLLSIKELRTGLVFIILIALIDGLYLIYVGGLPILAIGFFSILFLLGYSGGPIPYGYRGLGDLFVFIFFGLVAVVGTYYVQALRVENTILIGSLPSGALITAILVVNNYRDIETDRKTGKKTLAVVLGKKGSISEYILLLLIAYMVPLYFFSQQKFSIWILLTWLTLPLAIKLIKTLHSTTEGPILNETLAGTARLNLIFSIFFSIGIIIR